MLISLFLLSKPEANIAVIIALIVLVAEAES